MIAGWFTPISPACQTKRKPTILALRPPPIIACERYHDVVVRVPILRRGVRYFVRSPANQHGGQERTDSPLHGVLLNARRREATCGHGATCAAECMMLTGGTHYERFDCRPHSAGRRRRCRRHRM